MDELSLYILDITMNSVRAGADKVTVSLYESDSVLRFSVQDNGCGMTEEQLARLRDPFFTTRKTRKVGLGIPFLTMLAEMTDGHVTVTSVHESQSTEHGTAITAEFGKNHIDCLPLGDIVGTYTTLIQGSPDIAFTFIHETPNGTVRLCTEELREILGDISLAEPEILIWIEQHLHEQYNEINYK